MSNGSIGFAEKLERILGNDNKSQFVKLLRDHPSEINRSLLNNCVKSCAKKCLLALLKGDHGYPVPTLDLEEYDDGLIMPQGYVTPLAYVSHNFPDPQVINLMLTRCDAIPLTNVSCTIALVHGFPLHFVLLHLSFRDHLYNWSRGDSLIKLVILLCQWKSKSILDSARLLAQYTNSVNTVAWSFAKNGGRKQLVALLLIAREKVMAPFDTGLTIRDYITCEIDSFSEDGANDDQVEYRNMLIDARLLLDVFERAGDALSLYCSSRQKYIPVDRVLVDVSELLKKAQIYVSYNDLDLYDCYRDNLALTRQNTFKIAGPHDAESIRKCLRVRAAPVAIKRKSYQLPPWGKAPKPKSWISPNFVSTGTELRSFSTIACEVRKISQPVDVNPLLKHLPYISMKLMRGFRFL